MNYCRECVVIDFDGTLTELPDFCDYAQADIGTELITDCQERGYAVAVSTCSVVVHVAAALKNRGIPAWADTALKQAEWHDGSLVLVTNRKVHGVVFLDDKAMPWWYGRWATDIWPELERRRQLNR